MINFPDNPKIRKNPYFKANSAFFRSVSKPNTTKEEFPLPDEQAYPITRETALLYDELNQISEEIELCRLRIR